MDGDSLKHGSFGACIGNILFAMAHAAALMGAERNDCLSGQIIALQEGKHRHGRRSPPIRISQENNIVGPHVCNLFRQLRPGFGTQFILGNFRSFRIIFGIGTDSFDVK